MAKKIIESAEAPKAIGPYSQAVASGGFLFLSGQIGIDPDTGELSGGIREQAAQALKNLMKVLGAAGVGPDDVAKTCIYLKDMGDFAQVNEIYAGYFKDAQPARSTIQVAALPRGALVEIDAIARLGE